MGEVYRARDTRLDRMVAVKVVSQEAAGSEMALERFEREARAASALNHPNICTIYDVGVAMGAEIAPPSAGLRYLVMELLDGETLQQRLTRGSLHVAAIIDMGIALADALDAAHAAGIIHRDIKPANIFLAARGPKLLDFGLAKTASAPQSDSSEMTIAPEAMQTRPGTTVGTIAYMSPEQLRGEELDPRSDLFSLGLVLYEMAAGQPAFGGSTSAVISAAILHKEPVAPRQIRAEVPERLEAVILKSLEKDRDIRCQTAAELRADLKRLKRESDSKQVLNATIAIPALAEHAPAPARPATAKPASVAATPAPSSDADLVAAAVYKKFRNGLVAIGAVVVVVIALAAVLVNRWATSSGGSGVEQPVQPSGPSGPRGQLPGQQPSRSDGTLMARADPAPVAPAQPPPPAPNSSQAAPPSSSSAPKDSTRPSSPATASAPPPAVEPPAATPAPSAPATPLPAPPADPGALRIVPLTKSGSARRPAISFDGSLVAYVQQQGEAISVWIHRMADGSDRQLVAAEAGVQIVGVTVAPDASFVDYARRAGSARVELWRAPLGGAPVQRIIDRIDSLTAWSPDGQQMAFVRVIDRPAPTVVLVVADKDGKNERPLGGTRRANPIFNGLGIVSRPGVRPAWSPDARAIAVPGFERRASVVGGGGGFERRGGGGGNPNRRGLTPDSTDRGNAPGAARGAGQIPVIVFVDAANGRERNVPTDLPVTDLAWLTANTLVLDRPAEQSQRPQLWRLTEPGNQMTRLTTDGYGYADVSVTADGMTLVTTRYEKSGATIVSNVVVVRGIR